MGWKNLKTWIKGSIIGSLVALFFSIVPLPITHNLAREIFFSRVIDYALVNPVYHTKIIPVAFAYIIPLIVIIVCGAAYGGIMGEIINLIKKRMHKD